MKLDDHHTGRTEQLNDSVCPVFDLEIMDDRLTQATKG